MNISLRKGLPSLIFKLAFVVILPILAPLNVYINHIENNTSGVNLIQRVFYICVITCMVFAPILYLLAEISLPVMILVAGACNLICVLVTIVYDY